MEYEVTIGLEVHVQLKTRSKVFAPSGYTFGAEPNTLLDPVVLALPGTLPVLNEEALRQCIRLGLMLGCTIAHRSHFDRKNYFYPDLPKNYQISQYDHPICLGGNVEIELPGPSKAEPGPHRWIALTRIHLEEDPGKLTHGGGRTLIDFNRAGVPLAEIVTEPVLKSADEAVAFLQAIRLALQHGGISDGDMEKGQLRCDANVSLAPVGSDRLGTRTETKNLNSISAVKSAIQAEIRRQTQVLQRGGTIDQETRRWDAETSESIILRTKEDGHDYRYFPDPDLPPVILTEDYLAPLRQALPERPYEKQARYLQDLGLPYPATTVLIADPEVASYFEAALAAAGDHRHAKALANLTINNLLSALNEATLETEQRPRLADSRVTPTALAELVQLIDSGQLVKDLALKQVLPKMLASGRPAREIMAEEGLATSPADDAAASDQLAQLCQQALADPKNAKALEQFRQGNEKALNALMGPILKALGKSANPPLVQATLRKLASDLN